MPTENELRIAQFVLERNEALASLDEQKIRDMFKKWNGVDLPAKPETFWISVHKAITGANSLPIGFRRKSKAWLEVRGWTGFDDGDL